MNYTEIALIDKKIIITRAVEQTSEAHDIFKKKGAEVFDLPSLVIGPPDDWQPLDDALKQIYTFDWIIFSSANGVKNVEERIKQMNLSLSEISDKDKPISFILSSTFLTPFALEKMIQSKVVISFKAPSRGSQSSGGPITNEGRSNTSAPFFRKISRASEVCSRARVIIIFLSVKAISVCFFIRSLKNNYAVI